LGKRREEIGVARYGTKGGGSKRGEMEMRRYEVGERAGKMRDLCDDEWGVL